MEPIKFEASRLGSLSPDTFTDLLLLTGLMDGKQPSSAPPSTSPEATLAQEEDSLSSSETISDSRESLYYDSREKNETKDAKEAMQRRSASDTDLFSSPDGRRTKSMPELTITSSSKSIKGSKTSLASVYSGTSSCAAGSQRDLVDAIISLSALKALVVIIKSNRFLDTLLSYQAVELLRKQGSNGSEDLKSFNSRPSSSSSVKDLNPAVERPDDCMIAVLHSVMGCMVQCSVLPSPIKQVIRVGELERAQTVLLNQAMTKQTKTDLKEDKECEYILYRCKVYSAEAAENVTIEIPV